MQRLSADSRREIIDWMVFTLSGGQLYGDGRDSQPTDCDLYWIEEWQGSSFVAKGRRTRLEALSDEELLIEARRHYEREKQIAALMPRKRGRPKGAGSMAQADRPLLDHVHRLMAEGHSRHAATQIIAPRAPGYGTTDSKARRLRRRVLENKSD